MASLIEFLLLLAVSTINGFGVDRKPNERIISGTESTKYSHPFMVTLQDTEDYFHFCGGALINSRTVLTAAHCLYDSKTKRVTPPHELEATLGEHNIYEEEGKEVVRSVKKVIVHETYRNGKTIFDSDIALVILKDPVSFNDVIQPICVNSNKNLGSVKATVAGWGETRKQFTSSVLMETDLPVIDPGKCSSTFIRTFYEKHMLCAGYPELPTDHPDVCEGDSGGPLFMKSQGQKIQIGVASFGSGRGCAQAGWPSVFTKVAEFVSWIQANAEGEICVMQ